MKLKREFKKYGMIFTMHNRNDVCAIYVQKSNLVNYPIGYEVIQVRKNYMLKSGNLVNRFLPENAEIYPGSSEWGTRAWTCKTLDQAYKIFDSITKNENRNLQG